MSSAAEARDIGLDVEPPEGTCDDELCPFHGSLPVRGKVTRGKLISFKADRTGVVERGYLHFVPKYRRYERRTSRLSAHVPPCLQAREGQVVQAAECRPLSKTVSHVVVSAEEER